MRCRRPMLLAITALSLLAIVPLSAAEPAFRAGAAKADITPTKWPMHMVGTFNERLAEKAFDPLHARALVLDDGTTKIGFVVIDSCYVPRKVLDDAKARIAKSTGIATDHLLMSATHTHTAPASRDRRGVKADPEYVEQFTRGIVTAVERAHSQLEPAEIGWGTTPVPDEVFNRRWHIKPEGIAINPLGERTDRVKMNPPRASELLIRPAGPTDPDISFISVRATGGRQIGLLANYALHYVGGQPEGGVSADYFGEFCNLIEARFKPAEGENGPPPVGLLSNGTSGDINNINFREPGERSEPFARMRAVAKKVADAVLEKYPAVPHRRDVTLAMAQRLLPLDKRRPTPQQVARANEYLAAADPTKLPSLAVPYAKSVLELDQPPHSEEIVLQAVRIGELAITAIPCEVFAEIGLDLKKRSPLKPEFTIELANGHNGYLPTREQHALGGYETWLGTCSLEEAAAEKITAVLLELLGEVAASNPAKQAANAPPAAKAERPNIVLLLSDDQAWTDYGFMGHATIRTPRLDKLAAESVVFRRGYVPTALCRPSLLTLITGHYAHRHGVTGNDPSPAKTDPASPEYSAQREALISKIDRFETLPKLLATRGYLSYQSGKWWEGNFRRGGFTHGMTRGFPQPGGRHGDDGLKIGRDGIDPIRTFVADAVRQQKPFFLWYAPMLPHTPHNPPARLLEKYEQEGRPLPIARYFAMCEWWDETCGQVLDCLDEHRVRDNTLVVYVTDNGWIQDPHGNVFAPRSKQSPYEGGVRTPILFSWPKHWPPAVRDDLVSSIDIFPTLLAAAGIEPPADRPGLNLEPHLQFGRPIDRDTLFGEGFSHDITDLDNPEATLLYRWCIEGRWKLLLTYDGDAGRQTAVHPRSERRPQLFDLLADPTEANNLAAEQPVLVARLAAKIDAWYPVRERQTLTKFE